MFALEGADVAIVYLPEEEVDAQETKRLIEQAGQICLTIPQDIREEEGCKRVIDLVVREFGRIDVLVNNASGELPSRVSTRRDDALYLVLLTFSFFSSLLLSHVRRPRHH